MAKKDYAALVDSIIELTGGKSNISYAAHCMTRLRLNLKDRALVKTDEIKALSDVMGAQWTGDQFQIIIGKNIDDIYSVFCSRCGLEEQAAIDENLDGVTKRDLTPKGVINIVVGYLSKVMGTILPVVLAAGMCKTIGVLIGPELLNLVTTDSDLYIMFDFLYDAAFYFLPLFLGYSAAKVLNVEPIYGMFIGAMIIVPDFVAMVGVRDTFTIFGIPCSVASYASSFLPVVLGVPVLKYVLQFFKKIIPALVSMVFVPLLTILVMTPLMFCVMCPLGNVIGTGIGSVLLWMSNANIVIRLLGSVTVAALFPILIGAGMHGLLINVAVMAWLELGFEGFVFPAATVYSWAIYGLPLGAFLKIKDKEEKGSALSCFISGILGGISEPALYGVGLKYKHALVALMSACGLGGLYIGIFQPKAYIVGNLINIFSIPATWAAGGTVNMVHGIVACVISFVAAVILGYAVVDYSKKQ